MRKEKTAYLIHFLRLKKFFLHTGPCYIHKVQWNYYNLPRSNCKIFPSHVVTSPYFGYTFSFYVELTNEKYFFFFTSIPPVRTHVLRTSLFLVSNETRLLDFFDSFLSSSIVLNKTIFIELDNNPPR